GGGRNGGGGRGGNGGGKKTPAPAGPKTPHARAAGKTESHPNHTVESPQGGGGKNVLKKKRRKQNRHTNKKQFNKETPLSSVTLKGNELTFSYDVNFGGNAMTVTVKAIVTDTTLEGNMTVGQFGTFPIKGTKAQ